MRVLIAEDEPDIRKLIEMTLESFGGITVIEAFDGSAALTMAKILRPALVILDGALPVMDCCDVCKEIRRSKELSHTKVIMLTTRTQEADVARCNEAGCDVYMTKPFSPDILIEAVEACLGMKRI